MLESRINICFPTLSPKQEQQITNELIDFIAWYNLNQDRVNKKILENKEEIVPETLVNYWIANIGKPENVEYMLKDINVIADSYNFINKYQSLITLFKKRPTYVVLYKKDFRTFEQRKKLTSLYKNKFQTNHNNPSFIRAKLELEDKNMNNNHIDKKTAQKIILQWEKA